MQSLHWTYKHFTSLNTQELYTILSLRSEVFVVEQNCVYLDADNKDLDAWHLCGWENDTLVAYVRILAPGVSYEEASIGRVLTNPTFRKNGYGVELMKVAIEKTMNQFDVSTIKIGAQLYLLNFYSNLSFTQTSEMYMEDGIPHIEMLYNKETAL
jgi:ElaA protein